MQDVTGLIFNQYRSLLEEAINKENFEEIESFWQKSFKMGPQGLKLRKLIEEKSGLLVFSLLEKYPILSYPFVGRQRDLDSNPLSYQELRTLWHASKILDFLKKGQYSNAYSYAVYHEQETSFLKIPPLSLGALLRDSSLGTYLYFFAKCCLAVNREAGKKIDDILNLQDQMSRNGLKIKTIKNLARNMGDNHDSDVQDFLMEILEDPWRKEFASHI